MFKNIKSIILTSCLVSLLSGCASNQEPIDNLNLQWATTAQNNSKSTINVAMIYPYITYQNSRVVYENSSSHLLGGRLDKATNDATVYHLKKILPDFKTALTNDIEELLLSKGLRLSYKIANKDELTYNDKKNIDFIVVVETDFHPEYKVSNEAKCTELLVFPVCTAEQGELFLEGQLKLTMIEPLTGEKMIVKSVDVNSIANRSGITTSIYKSTNAAINGLTNIFNTDYPIILDLLSTMIDNNELSVAVKDSKKIKNQKRY